jgi:hypothetical protein
VFFDEGGVVTDVSEQERERPGGRARRHVWIVAGGACRSTTSRIPACP